MVLFHNMSAESDIYLGTKGKLEKVIIKAASIGMFAYFVAVFLHNTTSIAVYNRTIFVNISVTSHGSKLKVDMRIQLPNSSNQMNIVKATTCSNVQRAINSNCFLA